MLFVEGHNIGAQAIFFASYTLLAEIIPHPHPVLHIHISLKHFLSTLSSPHLVMPLHITTLFPSPHYHPQIPFLLLSKPLICRSCQRIWQCITQTFPFMHIPEQVEIALKLINNSHSSLRDVWQYWDEELKIRGCSTVRNGWNVLIL